MMTVRDRTGRRLQLADTSVAGVLFLLFLLPHQAFAENWRIQTGLTTRMVVTDNIDYSATSPKSDTLVEVNPSVSVSRTSARLKFLGAYTPHYFHYVDDTSPSRLSHAFNLNGSLEVVDDFFFLDGRAVSAQQNRSVFNAVPTDNALSEKQLSTTRTYSLTPSLRGNVRLGDVALWSSSFNAVRSESSGNQGSISSETFTGALESTPAKVGWRVDVSSVSTSSDFRGDTQRDRITGSLVFRPDAAIQLTARYGYEDSDVGVRNGGSNAQSGATYGGSVVWTPTPRTSLNANIDKRPYATTTSLNASHRLPHLVFNVVQSRSLTNRAQQQLQPTGTFDRFDGLSLIEPFASITDPAQRDQAMANYLRDNGLNRFVVGLSPILTDREFLQTRTQFSVTYTGVRNTLSLSLFQSQSDSGVGSRGVLPGDDFALSEVISQRGWNASYSHRFTASTALSLTLSSSESTGRSASSLKSDRDVMNATWTTALGARSSGSIGFRMTRATVSTGDVDENAVIATLTTRFN